MWAHFAVIDHPTATEVHRRSIVGSTCSGSNGPSLTPRRPLPIQTSAAELAAAANAHNATPRPPPSAHPSLSPSGRESPRCAMPRRPGPRPRPRRPLEMRDGGGGAAARLRRGGEGSGGGGVAGARRWGRRWTSCCCARRTARWWKGRGRRAAGGAGARRARRHRAPGGRRPPRQRGGPPPREAPRRGMVTAARVQPV